MYGYEDEEGVGSVAVDEGGYYDEYGQWIDNRVQDDPNLDKIDEEGRLIDEQKLL